MKRTAIITAMALAMVCISVPILAGEITIKRDAFDMPHVYADSTYDLFYGYGYAIAQDRLYSLDMARRTATGHVAEVLGSDYIDYDRKIRSGFWPPAIRKQIEQADPEDRKVLEGYAAGVNAWIDKIRANPDKLLPLEYTKNDFKPKKWSAYDVAMVFVGSMLGRYGDFNTEIENAALLQKLTKARGAEEARKIFNTLLARHADNAPTTIPEGDWDPARRDVEDADLRPVQSAAISPDVLKQAAPVPPDFMAAEGKALPRDQWRSAMVDRLSHQGPSAMRMEAASNMIILGRDKAENANAILLNGPQFGWYRPAYTYSIGLHGAGYDVAGNTALGYPALMFAHNERIAWGSTWAAGDQVDIFKETLNPDDPDQYRHDGQWVDMDTREENIQVKDGDPVTFTARRTIHGPIVATDDDRNIAYAKKRAWSGAELSTLFSWVHLMKAQDFDSFRKNAAQSAVNVNLYYADIDGNIGYVFGGYYPKRAEGHDGRLPVSGEGEYDWQGIMPFDSNPQVLNPSSHMIANWNNRPAVGFPSPDEWWYSWMPADRVSLIQHAFKAQKHFTPQQAWNTLIARVAFQDPNAPVFIPFIEKATADLDTNDPRRQLADMLVDWDYSLRDANRDGRYDAPAAAVMQIWLATILENTYADLPEPYSEFFATTGYPDPDNPGGAGTNLQVGAKVLHYNLLGKGHDFLHGNGMQAIRKALATTYDKLEDRYGPDTSNWYAPAGVIRFSYKNFNGIPQTLPDRAIDTPIAMNRGTQNDLVVFTNHGIEGYEVVPPGQSGFIAPDGTTPRTYSGQEALYENLDYKRVWFSRDDVDKHAVSTTRIESTKD